MNDVLGDVDGFSPSMTARIRATFHTGPKRLVAFLALALAIGLGASTVHRATRLDPAVHRSDFMLYRAAGQAALNGTDIYQAHNIRANYYLAPPLPAILMVPLAFLPVFWGSLLVYLLFLCMFGHTVHLAVQLARRFFPAQRLEAFWLYVVTVLLVLIPSLSGISRENPSLVVTYLLTLSLALFLRNRSWSAGLALAGGIAMKVWPVLFVAYFLAKRRWMMALSASVWLVVLVLVLPSLVFGVRGNIELLRRWYGGIVKPLNDPTMAHQYAGYHRQVDPPQAGRDAAEPRPIPLPLVEDHRHVDPYLAGRQSLRDILVRWFAGQTGMEASAGRERIGLCVGQAVNVALLLATAWACRRGAAEAGQVRTLWEFCSMIPLMLLVSPYVLIHYFSAMALPVAVAVAFLTARDTVGHTLPMAIGLGLYVVAGALLPCSHRLYALGIFPCGVLALWAAFVWTLNRRTQRD
jgi:hypothetical protein